MRVWWLTALAGCGFHVPISSDAVMPIDDGTTVDDADVTEVDASPIDASFCPATYVALGAEASRYFLRRTALDVVAHHNQCVADGTHLAVIDTLEEAAAVKQLVDGTLGLPVVGPYTLVYIGAAQRPAAQTLTAGWISATGPFNGSFWATGDPQDNGGGEDGDEQFAAVYRGNNLLADVPGDLALSALCECDGKAVTNDFKTLIDAESN